MALFVGDPSAPTRFGTDVADTSDSTGLFLKVFGGEFDNQNVKTTTPYLLQFGPVYDYIDGEEFSKIVLEFETADSYKIFKKSISIGKSLTYDKPHTLSVTLGKDSYSMHIDDV